jgi:release factor glutamine methyltransferase
VNAGKHGCGDLIRFLAGDLFDPVRELDLYGRVDCVTANPPYIRRADLGSLQPEVRDFEPQGALISGPEGTEILERIIGEAPRYLKSGGVLIMEMGIGQAPELVTMMEKAGVYEAPEVLKDLAGIDRVIFVRKK